MYTKQYKVEHGKVFKLNCLGFIRIGSSVAYLSYLNRYGCLVRLFEMSIEWVVDVADEANEK